MFPFENGFLTLLTVKMLLNKVQIFLLFIGRYVYYKDRNFTLISTFNLPQ
jgi:hypothetical protein